MTSNYIQFKESVLGDPAIDIVMMYLYICSKINDAILGVQSND